VHFRKNVQGITREAEKLLVKYDWPGNVRELRNVIERAIILETSETIQVESLPGEIRGKTASFEIVGIFPYDFEIPESGISLLDLEKSLIKQALQKTNYNQTRAAQLLGVSRDSLRYKKKKYHL
jgi:transcriptional regulator with PAS, ATPase and Fis domain